MNIVYFEPTIHLWKDLVLFNSKPSICRYGKDFLDNSELQELTLTFDFDLIIFPNFNEDDVNLDYEPIYMIFYKGKLLSSISYYDNEKFDKIKNIFITNGVESRSNRTDLQTEVLKIEKANSSYNNSYPLKTNSNMSRSKLL